ncbi:hypothetical protein [Atlantibacter hermannii]|uniref:hypothetical protein n=1 Tax=Atlantibacter hermannii TaxID=565 RepID=UPI002541B009|nr:hypothetical protein [Atlantibacter hermannii]WIF59805.1 hypothetical protein QN094_08700 [Atlantibacter hermannii]
MTHDWLSTWAQAVEKIRATQKEKPECVGQYPYVHIERYQKIFKKALTSNDTSVDTDTGGTVGDENKKARKFPGHCLALGFQPVV